MHRTYMLLQVAECQIHALIHAPGAIWHWHMGRSLDLCAIHFTGVRRTRVPSNARIQENMVVDL